MAEVDFFLSFLCVCVCVWVVAGTKDSIAEYVFVCSLRHKIYNYLDKASQDSGATKEKAEGDDDVGEESKDQDDDVRLPPIA